MKRYWISWYCTEAWLEKFEYPGPWWITGEDGGVDEYRLMVCAAVVAATEDDARLRIVECHDDHEQPAEWRFCTQKPDDWAGPSSSRFERAPWMQWPWPPEPTAEA